MSINLNRVTITGYLAQEPALIDLPAGQQACELRIACNRRWQHQLTGRWQEWADFFDARIVGGLAPIAQHRLHVGHAIAIDGRLTTQCSPTNNANDYRSTVIIAEEVQFLTPTTKSHPTTTIEPQPLPGQTADASGTRAGDLLVSDEDAPSTIAT